MAANFATTMNRVLFKMVNDNPIFRSKMILSSNRASDFSPGELVYCTLNKPNAVYKVISSHELEVEVSCVIDFSDPKSNHNTVADTELFDARVLEKADLSPNTIKILYGS